MLWTAIAVLAVASGLFTRLPAFAVQFAIALEMLVFVVVLVVSPRSREYLFSLDLRGLTGFHAWRILPGAWFLYSHYQLHQLPWNFAVPGGFGDLAVGLTALPASLLASASWKGRWSALVQTGRIPDRLDREDS